MKSISLLLCVLILVLGGCVSSATLQKANDEILTLTVENGELLKDLKESDKEAAKTATAMKSAKDNTEKTAKAKAAAQKQVDELNQKLVQAASDVANLTIDRDRTKESLDTLAKNHSKLHDDFAALEETIAKLKHKRTLAVVGADSCLNCLQFDGRVIPGCGEVLTKDYEIQYLNCDHQKIPFDFQGTPSVAVLNPDTGEWSQSWNPTISVDGFLNDLYMRSGGKRGRKSQ